MPVEKLNPDYNLEEARLHQLKSLFPEVVKDGDIDFEVLREVLGLGEDDDSVEHFGLSWAGKRQARKISTNPSKGTLIPLQGEGINEDSTGNIFIEGDNLEVLKLLQKSYAGRIKMIYIDPPYNTGNDFIYKDDFKDSTADYLQKTAQADEKGQLLTSNPKSSGRYHANWLSMMYPRLRVAKNLLTEDGVIFISIDDNEVHNLRTLCNEIFGEENFIGNIVRTTGQTTGQDSGGLGSSFDFIILYSKNNQIDLSGLPLTEQDKKRFNNKDEKGYYAYDQMRKTGSNDLREDRPNMYYPVIDPDGMEIFPISATGYESRWRFERKTYEKFKADNYILWKKTKRGDQEVWWPYVKYYLEGRSKRPSPLWTDLEGNKKASRDLRDIFDGKKVFDFPKPIEMLKKCISIAPEFESNDIVLDFFAGSCTTAQAVMELNKEDGGDRKFICVQIGEETDEKSEAFKAGYKTIAEIGKERIRRAIKKIEEELSGQLELKAKPDLGFKVYKLHQSNLKLWQDYEGSNTQQLEMKLLETENPFREGWTPEKVITEIQLLEGFPLDSSITQSLNFTKNQVVCLSHPDIGHRLFICLDEKLAIDTIQQVRLLEDDDRFICLDYALTDQQKVMLEDGCNVKTI